MSRKVVLTDNALKVAQSRYFMEGEDWSACSMRAASTMASSEVTKRQYWLEQFYEIIYNQYFIPGGRILRNSGRPRGSLLNCYHLPIGDSIEEIGQCIKDALILWSEGGGVGCNFSPLRPLGDAILGKGGQSSGLVSFIQAFDAVSHTIESGGSRRAAAIGHVDISHPEVLDFIDAKLLKPDVGSWLRDDTPEEIRKFVKEKVDVGSLQHFNISVVINNDFLDLVEQDGSWTFKFKQKDYGTVQAKFLWDKIIENMVKCAEPGLINWSRFVKNNSYYFAPVLGTNPCGETTLSPYEGCDLGSLVLPNFITSGNVNTNWKKLTEVVKTAVRFLDNVIDVNKYVLKDIDINAHKSRRIGVGVIGLAEYLFMKKIRYGSQRAVRETENVIRAIRDAAYQASIELAMEKGSFPMFDPLQYAKASFVAKLPGEMRMDIKKYGIRNCTTMALAPTGTISLLTNYNNAIEPLYAKAVKRHDRVGDRLYVHPKYEEILKSGEPTPDWFVDSYDLKPIDHLEMQVACQKYCDGAVSKTINLPEDITKEDLSALLLEYIRDLKGVTVYRDGSKEGQILNQISEDEIKEYLREKGVIDHNLSKNEVQCSTGSCEI